MLPKSDTHVRLTLDLLKAGPEFEKKLVKYMRPLIIKGVPSVITSMRNLYADPAKRDMIGSQLESMNKHMQIEMVLDPKDQ